jgi:uncharacterized DUF497 family protein
MTQQNVGQTSASKHKIDLADCEAVFDAPMLAREDASQDYGEQRLISLSWLRGRVVCWYGRIARAVPN